ncbi:MAG: UDP-N-acetylmuramate--L-alanine ligase [Candidatus Jorgensenbacteria bacterium]|nr:UDP-N-acetylmuramate--L-alanine ligase [Candidatus Jorgensenbacteria bacterium]
MRLDLNKIDRVHCIGIGGIGVSAIARMLHAQGKKVTGSDASPSPVTDMLKRLGIRVVFGHATKNVGRADLVVYTKAVLSGNPELRAARRRGIPTLSYAEMLGAISKDRYTVAVAGTHGKTTTTAMIGHILRAARLHPTIIVGGIMKNGGTNFVAGKGKYFVVEACEYKKSFLDLHPKIVVITNIDNDHLDYYRTIGNIRRAFAKFVGRLGSDGYLICDPRDANMTTVARGTRARVLNYSRIPLRVRLRVPGAYNKKNAQAAFAVARALGIPVRTAERALRSFRGVGRRFEYKGTWHGVRFYDDYAHHPTEVKATLRAARGYFGKGKKIWCVFQPHLYSRTRLLMRDFAQSFLDADEVLLADIYAAREKNDGKTNSRMLAGKISMRTPARYLGTFSRIATFLRTHAKRGDAVITMGAGEAYKVWNMVRSAR